MLTFAYTARDPASGEQIKSEIQADSEQAAAKLLKEQGLSPTSLEAKEIGQSGIGKLLHRVKTKDKVIFSRQLSTLINAGLPLVQSLRSVGKQTQSKKFQAVINQVITDVEAGNAFSVALGKHPDVFSRVYVSLVAAGETSGTLDKALERIASQQEKDAEIISKVRGAMVYPVIVLLVMFAVVGFMIVKVLPQVEVLYKGLPGTQLPLITRILLAISHFTIKFWWVVLIALVIMVVFGSRWARTLGGKRIVDKFKMKAWPIGPLFMKMYMARFARTGQTLFASGVPLIQMLQVTGNSIDNYHIEASLTTAVEKVKGGKSLSDALQGDRNFLDLVPDMLHIGEQSGSMEQMLGKVADYYEREVDNQIKTISTIIEPVLMVVLGVFAFIIVAAILLPIYGLAGKSIIH
ncbi:MAG TPA: type II secretion system F family protein [Candidatus Saccharimonadales bacterium]|nr:type II secretion system F family protein [Candidatus Saccharimonadales bacterium]